MIKREWRWLVSILALSIGLNAWAADLPRAQPAEVGFSPERLAHIDEFYADKVKSGALAGIVTLISRHGKIVHFSAVGYSDVEKKQKMQTDTIFRFYSMTKPIASSALMMLYQEGRFQMSDPVKNYLPEFANLRVLRTPDGPLDDTVAPVLAPTVQDLMRHTAGFTHGLGTDAFDNQYTKANVFGLDVSLTEMVTRLSKIPLRYQPGAKFVYSLGPDIQARLVEVLSGMPFDEYLDKRLFKPLGMRDAGFWVPADKAARLATVHWAKDGKLVPLDEGHGHPAGGVLFEPWSVNSYTVNHRHKGGSFGLVGTAEDYWRFAQMMLNGGEFAGTRFLSPQVVRYMVRDHLGAIPFDNPGQRPAGMGFGLGFGVLKDPAQAGYMGSEGSYFWAGAAATYFWIDPKEDMVVVALTQHMAVPATEALSAQLRTLVYSALME
jgi:CubicO group peptidase (beta-lactamase class C family)